MRRDALWTDLFRGLRLARRERAETPDDAHRSRAIVLPIGTGTLQTINDPGVKERWSRKMRTKPPGLAGWHVNRGRKVKAA